MTRPPAIFPSLAQLPEEARARVLEVPRADRLALLAAVFALPLGAMLAVSKFPGSRTLTVLINGFMGLPAVVVGLAVYLLLSRAGPLGQLGLLFTPPAMVVAP